MRWSKSMRLCWRWQIVGFHTKAVFLKKLNIYQVLVKDHVSWTQFANNSPIHILSTYFWRSILEHPPTNKFVSFSFSFLQICLLHHKFISCATFPAISWSNSNRFTYLVKESSDSSLYIFTSHFALRDLVARHWFRNQDSRRSLDFPIGPQVLPSYQSFPLISVAGWEICLAKMIQFHQTSSIAA